MKKTIKILLLSIFTLFAISMFSNVEAATASIRADKSNVNVGDSVTITVNINAASWNLSVSGAASKKIVGFSQELNNESRTEKITLDTSSAGSKTIVLSGDITDESGTTTSVNSPITVNVNEKAPETNNGGGTTSTPSGNNGGGNGGSSNNNNNNNNTGSKSSDATLKSITVGGEEYKEGDTKTVPADTSAIAIKATTNNSKATVTGTGTKELVVGTNNFTLTVTAENGAKKTYTVTIVREEFVEDNPNVIDPDQEITDLRLTSIEIENSKLSPAFDSEIFEYYADVINQDSVKINAIANAEDASIEIIGNTELAEGENIVTIRVTKDDKIIEYQITVTRKAALEETPVKKGMSTGTIIGIAVIVIAFIAIIGIAIWKKNNNNMDTRRRNVKTSSFDDFDN